MFEINKTFQGYEIQLNKPNCKTLYLKSIYKGKPRYSMDYLYSKKYKTLKSATKVVKVLETYERRFLQCVM